MKKLLILCLVTSCHISISQAQSFNRGSFILGANFGIDGNFANRNYFSSSEGNAQTLNGTAPASDFNITAEAGIFKWLGVGLIGRYNSYFPEANGVTQSTPDERAFDLGLTGNLHILSVAQLDVLAGIDYGFSHLTFNTNNYSNTTSASYGSWGDLHATARIYFGRLGVNATLYIPMMNYSSFTSSNMRPGDYIINDWKSTGYGASIGLQYRIL
jgi:hypothetical protein